MPDAVVGIVPHGRIAFLTQRAADLLGYHREELLGRPVTLVFPESGDFTTPPGEGGYRVEVAGKRKDGTRFTAEVSVGSFDLDDEPLTLAVVRDVTERARAETLFRGLLEAVPDAIVAVRPDGVIALANTQTERIFGYHSDELVGQSIEVLIPEEARAVHPGHRDAYFRNPTTRLMGDGLALAGRRRDGTTFPAEISLSSIETDEGVLVSVAVRDITDRVELEEERRRQALEAQDNQSQRLESLGQLAGGVAHDFNNLLGVILNYAEFVKRRVADDPVAQADVDEIRGAAERAAQLTHQLLAFGRREMVRPEVLDVNAVIAEIERLLRRTLGEQIDLVTDAEPSLPSVKVDPGQLEQVLLNLAVNARNAMPGGGTLHVDTASVEIEGSEQPGDLNPGSYVRLRVSDTGTGMDRETLDRAFEPFFTTKPQGEGTGLGLATVFGIVRQAGGGVYLYSEPGVGTTVAVYLPTVDEAPDDRRHPSAGSDPGGTESILLVEDGTAFREMARRILTERGYRVTAASRGDEAIEVFRQAPDAFDLLVTDVVMPKMAGPQLVEKVRAVRPNLPVVLMSGYAEPIIAAQRPADTLLVILEKPFTSEQLLRRVREALDEGGPEG